jgi:hypothetical protein
MLKVATAVRHIITELREVLSEEDKIPAIKKLVLNLMEENGRSKSLNLRQVAFGGSAISSVNSCKTYIQMWHCSQKHISNPMRGSLLQIITFIGLIVSREENAELPLQ